MIDTSLNSYNKEQGVLLMTTLKNKVRPFYARIIKRSFSTSLVMAALATLSACDAPNVDVAAQDEKAAKTAARLLNPDDCAPTGLLSSWNTQQHLLNDVHPRHL